MAEQQCAREILEVVPLIMRSIRTEIRRQRAPDLSVPQFRILAFLGRNAGASLSEVAEHIGIALPSASKMVDGLVLRKLAARRDSRVDRRHMELTLTVPGRAALRSARKKAQACLASKFSNLSQNARTQIIGAMEALRPIFVHDNGRLSSRNGP